MATDLTNLDKTHPALKAGVLREILADIPDESPVVICDRHGHTWQADEIQTDGWSEPPGEITVVVMGEALEDDEG